MSVNSPFLWLVRNLGLGLHGQAKRPRVGLLPDETLEVPGKLRAAFGPDLYHQEEQQGLLSSGPS